MAEGHSRVHSVGETEARVIAFETHRNTAIVTDIGEMANNLSVLAETVRTNMCPKRLILSGRFPRHASDDFDTAGHNNDAISAPVAALRMTTVLESVTVRIDTWEPKDDRRRQKIVEAVGQSVGVRHFAMVVYSGETLDFVKDLWSPYRREPDPGARRPATRRADRPLLGRPEARVRARGT